MKKLFTFILASLFYCILFAEQTLIPKNDNPISIDKSLYYCDDAIENSYQLYSIVWKSDSTKLISLHSIKTSLLTNVEVNIVVNFDTEEDLDSFIDFFYSKYNFKLRETPEYFNALKEYIIDLGIEPYYVMDDNNKPKQILYIATLTKNN